MLSEGQSALSLAPSPTGGDREAIKVPVIVTMTSQTVQCGVLCGQPNQQN